MQQESKVLKNNNDIPSEIPDDIEVIGLGRMLIDAREAMGLSHQEVADKLNFRITLVQEIEAEEFDLKLPAAFNRGYLKNYAKLVKVSEEDVLNSYDQLGVAQRQCAEMQSFSKGTEKQAEHNMLMWITYLILIALVTATVVWWYQTPSNQPTIVSVNSDMAVVDNEVSDTRDNAISDASVNQNETQQVAGNNVDAARQVIDQLSQDASDSITGLDTQVLSEQSTNSASSEATTLDNNVEMLATDVIPMASVISNQSSQENAEQVSTEEVSAAVIPASLVFTFSGDCWVNIYDATGERVAWGVKKSGYVMRFSGQAPFNVTLGKPELVQIEYNDATVDMTGFNAGNIAKFSLPLKP
jgi:cytoskeleton protein RodZ